MIIDKLAARSPWVKGFSDRAHAIQAPFAIFPPQESALAAKTALVPRDGQTVSGQFAKPLFDAAVIFGNGGEGREQGALFVASAPVETVDSKYLAAAPEDTTHVLLVTVAGLTDRFDCLVAYRFLVFCGDHFAAPPHMELVLHLSKQAFVDVNGFLPEDAGAVFHIEKEDWQNFVEHQVGAIAACFALLNCRNVVRKNVVPDAKLQRARKRSKRIPLYGFSTLAVTGIDRTSSAARAIHWVRGHFKEYTPERPLFGKIAGLFWWEPHLVGSREDGSGAAAAGGEGVLDQTA